jgi:membrane-associated phospholipid phosphatase
MNAPDQPVMRRTPGSSLSRRLIATIIVGGLLFLVLWLMALTALTSLLISAGFCVVVVAASTVSDLVETMLNIIVAIVFGVLAAIAAFFAAIFSNT